LEADSKVKQNEKKKTPWEADRKKKMERLEARMHALAQQIYRDVGGSVKHIASYESFLNSLVD
jgi:hypothetical protein